MYSVIAASTQLFYSWRTSSCTIEGGGRKNIPVTRIGTTHRHISGVGLYPREMVILVESMPEDINLPLRSPPIKLSCDNDYLASTWNADILLQPFRFFHDFAAQGLVAVVQQVSPSG